MLIGLLLHKIGNGFNLQALTGAAKCPNPVCRPFSAYNSYIITS